MLASGYYQPIADGSVRCDIVKLSRRCNVSTRSMEGCPRKCLPSLVHRIRIESLRYRN